MTLTPQRFPLEGHTFPVRNLYPQLHVIEAINFLLVTLSQEVHNKMSLSLSEDTVLITAKIF